MLRSRVVRARSLGLFSVFLLVAGCATGSGASSVKQPPPPPKPGHGPQCKARALELASSEAAPPKAGDAEVSLAKGRALANQGAHDRAVLAFGEALAIDPGLAEAHLAKAHSHLMSDGSLEAILKHTATALRIQPLDPASQIAFASALLDAQEPKVAALHYRCALALGAAADTELGLARAQLAAGEGQQAIEALHRAQKSSGDRPEIQVMIGQAHEAQGEKRKAAQALERAAKLLGRSAVLLRKAARLYEAAEDLDAAARVRSQADDIDPPARRRKMRQLRKAKPPPKGARG